MLASCECPQSLFPAPPSSSRKKKRHAIGHFFACSSSSSSSSSTCEQQQESTIGETFPSSLRAVRSYRLPPRSDPIYPFCRTTINSQTSNVEYVIETIDGLLANSVAEVASEFDSSNCSWECKAIDSCGAHMKFVIQMFLLRDGTIAVEWQRRLGLSPLFASLFKECKSSLMSTMIKFPPSSQPHAEATTSFSLNRFKQQSSTDDDDSSSSSCSSSSPRSTCASPPHSPALYRSPAATWSSSSSVLHMPTTTTKNSAMRKNRRTKSMPAASSSTAPNTSNSSTPHTALGLPPPVRITGLPLFPCSAALLDDDDDEDRFSTTSSSFSSGTTSASTTATTVVSMDKDEFSRACVSLKDWVRHDPHEALPAVSRLLPDIVSVPKTVMAAASAAASVAADCEAVAVYYDNSSATPDQALKQSCFSLSKENGGAAWSTHQQQGGVFTAITNLPVEQAATASMKRPHQQDNEQEDEEPFKKAECSLQCSSMRCSIDALDSLCLALCDIAARALQSATCSAEQGESTVYSPCSEAVTAATGNSTAILSRSVLLRSPPTYSPSPSFASCSRSYHMTDTNHLGRGHSNTHQEARQQQCYSTSGEEQDPPKAPSFFVEEDTNSFSVIVPAALSVIASFLTHCAAMEPSQADVTYAEDEDASSGAAIVRTTGGKPVLSSTSPSSMDDVVVDPTRAASLRCFVENPGFRLIVANAATLLDSMQVNATKKIKREGHTSAIELGGVKKIAGGHNDEDDSIAASMVDDWCEDCTGSTNSRIIASASSFSSSSSSSRPLSSLDMLAVTRARLILQSLRESSSFFSYSYSSCSEDEVHLKNCSSG